MKKLLFDFSSCTNLFWGTSKYSIRVLEGLCMRDDIELTILCNTLQQEFVETRFPNISILTIEPAKSRIGVLAYEYRRCRIIKHYAPDILMLPTLNIFRLNPKKCFVVQTIHDLQALKVMKGGKLWVYQKLLPRVIKNSDLLICISDFVKKEVENCYPIAKGKTAVVYNSVSINKTKRKPLVDKGYILWVNSLLPYKNVETLIKAYQKISRLISQKLVVVGKETEYWKNLIERVNDNYVKERIILLQNISDEELTSLYSNADLFVTTSLFEGFGFTPIEAAICGAPVLSTKETALLETTRGLLNYYEPATDSDALSAEILKILSEKSNAELVNNISRELTKAYSFSKCTDDLIRTMFSAYQRNT